MEIQFLGRSSFRIKGKQVILITDPFAKTFADIITVSDRKAGEINPALVKGTKRRPEPFVVTGPGEYEISGVSIAGFFSGGNTIYIIDMDGVRLVHLGNLTHKLSETQLEEVNGADVLFVPVGATETVGQVEPRITIPMLYKLPGAKDFLKLMGAEEIKPLPKLIITKDNLPEEGQVVVLDARN